MWLAGILVNIFRWFIVVVVRAPPKYDAEHSAYHILNALLKANERQINIFHATITTIGTPNESNHQI